MSGRRRIPKTGPSSVGRSVARNDSFLVAFMRTATLERERSCEGDLGLSDRRDPRSDDE